MTTRNQLTLTAASRLGPPVLGDGAGRVERGLDSSSLNETILHHYRQISTRSAAVELVFSKCSSVPNPDGASMFARDDISVSQCLLVMTSRCAAPICRLRDDYNCVHAVFYCEK